MNIRKVSYLLSKEQDDQTGKFKRNRFYDVRKKVVSKSLLPLNREKDTVFFIEKYDIEEATYYGRIWTKNDTVDYSFFAKKIVINNRSFFSSKMIDLISNWDTTLLREEEIKYPNSSRDIYAAKCVIINGRCLIDVIKTKEIIFDDK